MRNKSFSKKNGNGFKEQSWTEETGSTGRRKGMVTALLALVLLSGMSLSVYAATVTIAPVGYEKVGTAYVTKTWFIPDKSGGTLHVRTRPTTQTDAKLRIRLGKTTLAEGTFPYQTQGPYISATMSKDKKYDVQVRAVSGKVSGQISGYCSYGN